MASLQNSPPFTGHCFPTLSLRRMLCLLYVEEAFRFLYGLRTRLWLPLPFLKVGSSFSAMHNFSFFVYKRHLFYLSLLPLEWHVNYNCRRRQMIAVGVVAPWVSILNQSPASFAAESKKGFLSVTDKNDGYSFVYPFGWQEVSIEGRSRLWFPTRGCSNLINKFLAPPTQKTKIIAAAEHDVDGKIYYTFEFTAQAPNYIRHALGAVTVGNGKFFTLTTGANQRRWDKMKQIGNYH
ncbi:hypothetical protein LWI28_005314 [Acer negundo]|uniref:PsbP C-terminal domain-containing protein n=1 Tax=Acer negundo TaxID=4023 RepID=A0AAD5IBN8_ACENE|nr:hypothetical protein LWI28_005314 [Acer negundo]